MKILILGNKTNIMDEGAKNVATNISKSFEKTDEVVTIHQRKSWHPKNIFSAIKFKPDFIISIHGPSIKTIIIVWIYKFICRTKSVIVAAQPHNSPKMLKIASLLKPDYIFCQSSYWNNRFKDNGITTRLLPNGVDIDKFSTTDDNEILTSIKTRLNIHDNDRTLLHIGPINYNRNHELLMRISRETDWKVIIIGSTTAPFSQDLYDEIIDSGVIAFNEYFPNINYLYAVSDYYIFPVKAEDGSIEFPLTVLEAMASGCPVISTRFKGIPDFINETASFRYFDTYDDLLTILENNRPKPDKNDALPFSWDNITSQIKNTVLEKI